jgi:hypothetical protein
LDRSRAKSIPALDQIFKKKFVFNLKILKIQDFENFFSLFRLRVGGIDRPLWAPYYCAIFFEIGFETVEICVLKLRNWQSSRSHNFCLALPILMCNTAFGRTFKDLQNALLTVAVSYVVKEILLIKDRKSENPENSMPAFSQQPLCRF